ncbi:MAG: hypothetical protein IPI19_13950 [Ignavibacteriales bacterium]|nr:hypothetical protein [Ignavibacteriales bacterium]
MNNKIINSELFAKVFNLLDFLEANCKNLIFINSSLISLDENQYRSINKNLEALEMVHNKIIVIKEEVAEQTKKQIAILQKFKLVDNVDPELARILKILEMLSTEILDDTYYVNQNGKIIK